MAYSSPSVAASGITFAQLQSSGVSGHLERLITANTGAGANLTPAQIRLLRAIKVKRLDQVYCDLQQCVTAWTAGTPIATAVVAEARLFDLHMIFAVLSTLCAEAGTLIDANPGTLTTVATGVGGRTGRRTFP